MKLKKKSSIILAAVVFSALFAGCTQQAKDDYGDAGQSAGAAASKVGSAVSTDAKATGAAISESTKDAAAKTKPEMDKAGADIKDAAKNVASAASTTAAEAKEATDRALMTGKVKSALKSAAGLDTSALNVDTEKDGAVHLTGSVPTAAQKKQAESVAKGIVGSTYKLDNELTVAASSTK